MSDFAKIFRHPSGKQILVMKDSGEKAEPVINIFVEPEEFGVCSVSMKYSDDDEGWDKRDEMFDATDEEKAIEVTNAIFRQSGQEVDES